jgi:nitrogen fixation/metabolism regulation signal transduction histidine kinase
MEVAGLLLPRAPALYLARSMVRPIDLQEGAQTHRRGDLDSQIEVRTGDELEALAAQFNRMTAQLRESYAGLERRSTSAPPSCSRRSSSRPPPPRS